MVSSRETFVAEEHFRAGNVTGPGDCRALGGRVSLLVSRLVSTHSNDPCDQGPRETREAPEVEKER